MIITEFPGEFLAPAEIAEVERYLTFLEDLRLATTTGEKLLAAEARAAVMHPRFIIGFFAEIISIAGLAYAAFELVEGMTVEARRLAENQETRRKKTGICAKTAADIVERHRLLVNSGRFQGAQFLTNDNSVRFPRKFKSRA